MVRIEAAGIVDMGSDPLPAQVKILRARGRVDTLIVNAAECEPYLTADHRLLLEKGDQVLQGVQMMARLLRVERAVLVVAGDKLNAVEFWSAACAGRSGRWSCSPSRPAIPWAWKSS